MKLAVSTLSGLGVVIASARGGGTISRGSRVLGVVSSERSRMFAGESNELVALATLWNLDAIAVGPLLDLAVAPALEELIAE